MNIESRIIRLLIETFTEECIEEINKQKHPDPADVFNFGLASADAAVRRTKTKWIEKLRQEIKKEDNEKIF
jgi:transcription initiation factor IIE alpha subunit